MTDQVHDNRTPERRAITTPVELRADADGTKHIVGYAAVFDSPTDLGWFVEEVARGAFAETIGKDDIRALGDHHPSRILGRNQAGTLALVEDDHGLLMDITIPDTSVGRDIQVSVERGDITGASFSFDVLDNEWRTVDGKEFRRLTRVKLYDTGPVTFPAYPDTTVAVRSRDAWRAAAAPTPDDREPENTPDGPADELAMYERRQRQIEARQELGRV